MTKTARAVPLIFNELTPRRSHAPCKGQPREKEPPFPHSGSGPTVPASHRRQGRRRVTGRLRQTKSDVDERTKQGTNKPQSTSANTSGALADHMLLWCHSRRSSGVPQIANRRCPDQNSSRGSPSPMKRRRPINIGREPEGAVQPSSRR